jgi:large subunit ribosomal protein L6|uniref:Large ribosomal subunit protein uL6c n=1 Tax=Galdieria yellowstonensis TaxID=3028027 RepID=A0A9Y1MXS2_9RHOD|nr:ribosomal protein L6 [Galdieria yellowstonensis]
MSRIGKLPISIPENVNVYLEDNYIIVKGKEGELRKKLIEQLEVTLKKENNRSVLMIAKKKEDNKTNELYGLYRTLINNMIIGVNNKFTKYLELKGVGYRSQLENKILILNLGYSHPIRFTIPDSISIEVENNTIIKISGIDKQLVGEIAARIRNFRLPEPYKGKGIHYRGEYIKLKAGKTGKK